MVLYRVQKQGRNKNKKDHLAAEVVVRKDWKITLLLSPDYVTELE